MAKQRGKRAADASRKKAPRQGRKAREDRGEFSFKIVIDLRQFIAQPQDEGRWLLAPVEERVHELYTNLIDSVLIPWLNKKLATLQASPFARLEVPGTIRNCPGGSLPWDTAAAVQKKMYAALDELFAQTTPGKDTVPGTGDDDDFEFHVHGVFMEEDSCDIVEAPLPPHVPGREEPPQPVEPVPEPLTPEEASRELDAFLRVADPSRLRVIEEKFGGDPVIAAKVAAAHRAIATLTDRPAGPAPAMAAAMPAAPELPEPTIDLSGNVPEQVSQLCRWFRAKIAEADTGDEVQRAQRRQPIVAKFQAQLHLLVGRSFGSVGNAGIAKAFREALKATQYRVSCKCGFPGLPHYQLAEHSTSSEGAFQTIHYYKGGLTRHGGSTTFPAYAIVPAPSTPLTKRPPAPSKRRSQ